MILFMISSNQIIEKPSQGVTGARMAPRMTTGQAITRFT